MTSTGTKHKKKLNRPLLLGLVFFGGFANLALEIIGPRMLSSIHGTTTTIWAMMISITLVGLSAGYAMGGSLRREQVPNALPGILIGNALWLIAVGWIIWGVSGLGFSVVSVFFSVFAAFFVPSVLFGFISPMVITLLADDEHPAGQVAGNVYALGTMGSVAGALTAAFFWIPYVGLALSLRLFALGLVAFAVVFLRKGQGAGAGIALALVILVPGPQFRWAQAEGRLVEQREGYHQTLRVYTDDETFVQMFLGPTFHSRIDIDTGEPLFNYARKIVEMADAARDLDAENVLVIGGAGHAMARSLERRGATVTEVEIDPVVVQMSDTHFGPIEGEVVVADGRPFIEQAAAETYDLVIVDAFDDGAGVAPQLTTVEFFRAVERSLTADGLMLYNFVGTPRGFRSGSYAALSRTIDAAFELVGASGEADETSLDRQNIIFAASPSTLGGLDLPTPLPEGGWLLTDERNPVEMLLEQARGGFYFRR